MRWTYVVPASYLTLPVTALELLVTAALGQTRLVLIPSGVDYDTAHVIYFWPSALLITALLYGVGSAASREPPCGAGAVPQALA
jgi:hypothetical protein